MAVVCSLRTSGIFLLLFLIQNTLTVSPPWILSVNIDKVECSSICAYKLKVNGDYVDWSLTHEPANGGKCLPEFLRNGDVVDAPNNEKKLYFCAKSADGVWFHQGDRLYLDAGDVIIDRRSENSEEIETLDNSIENEVDNTNDLQDDVAVNEDGQHIGDVLIETFVPHGLKTELNVPERLKNKNNVPEESPEPFKIKQDVVKTNIPHNLEINKPSDQTVPHSLKFTQIENGESFVSKNEETQVSDQDFIPQEVFGRKKRQVIENATVDTPADSTKNVSDLGPKETAINETDTSLGTKVTIAPGRIRILGLRVEESAKEPKIIEEEIPSVLRETKFTMRLFGEHLTEDTVIAFTHTPDNYGVECDHLLNGEYKVTHGDGDSAVFIDMIAPPPLDDYKFYICAKNSQSDHFIHQGAEKWKILATHNKLLPLWASLILIVILLMLASLFSGLNLGLMALDRTELKIIANTGTEKERKYARAIMPVRAHGNYLLCTILLSNVAVNSTFTVILDDLTSGLVAVIGSTLAIVFIAEITPQAICARHGLLVGAKSIWIMKIVMGICAPLAWPTSKLLDYFLGEEIGTHYNRERLKELVRVTDHVNDLDKEEVNIISGALDLRKKKVSDVMTKLKDCFMLPINSVLDFETMSEIVKSGYSRIPVYEGSRGNIVTVLFIKDLAFVDPDDNTPLRTLCQYYQNPCNFVFEDVTLDVMLKQFKEGHKGHMAFVQRIEEGDGDPVYETVGLVTLEDVIEEMIQAEIVDETDVFSDNRTKKRLTRPVNKFQDLAAFAGHHEHQRVHVSPQLVLATFQFLNTSVDAFRPEYISENVLRRLLKQDVIQHIKLKGDEDKNDPKRFVFQEGKAVDYFVLILEGRVEVTVGRENLVFEAGPFTYFGVQALTQNVGVAEAPSPSTRGSLQNLNMDSMLGHTFVPDYSVKAIAELYYLAIKRTMYLNAKRATLMEKGALNKGGTNEQIEPEVDKLLREGERIDELHEIDLPKQIIPASASPYTNSTFRKSEQLSNPEKEKLLKK